MSEDDVLTGDSIEAGDTARIIEAVGCMFSLCLYIDVKSGTYRTISTNEHVSELAYHEDVFDFLKSSVDALADDNYRAEFTEWFCRERVLSALKKNDVIDKDFYSKEDGKWFRSSFTVADRDKSKAAAHIIYACYDIDKAKKTELENQKEILKQYSMLKSMSDIYYSMHLIDLVEDTLEIYRAKNEVAKFTSKTAGAVVSMHTVIKNVTSPDYVDEALKFTDLTTVSERMKDKKIISGEFIGNRIGWFQASFIAVEFDDDKRPTKVVFTTRSIDGQKKKEESLIFRSNTDELTGLYNRRAYEEACAGLKAFGIADDLVYVSADVNELKTINDTIGHEAGDELIIGAGECLRQCLGEYGELYRTGGDEFTGILRMKTSQIDGVKKQLEEVCSKWKGRLVETLSLSYGFVAGSEIPRASLRRISIVADKRMYEAKARHYSEKGIDRRGQKDAHVALCSLYTKTLKINITDDTCQEVNMDDSDRGDYTTVLSEWRKAFVASGEVHPDDAASFLEKTDPGYLETYFSKGNLLLRFFYRRRYGDTYRQVMTEAIPANDYRNDSKSLFVYVKDIDSLN